jgi:hypothetical protein
MCNQEQPPLSETQCDKKCGCSESTVMIVGMLAVSVAAASLLTTLLIRRAGGRMGMLPQHHSPLSRTRLGRETLSPCPLSGIGQIMFTSLAKALFACPHCLSTLPWAETTMALTTEGMQRFLSACPRPWPERTPFCFTPWTERILCFRVHLFDSNILIDPCRQRAAHEQIRQAA